MLLFERIRSFLLLVTVTIIVTISIQFVTISSSTHITNNEESDYYDYYNSNSNNIHREDTEELHKADLFERALFNVTVNFIVPMCSVGFPRYSASGEPLDLVYQVILAGFGIFAAMGYIGIPSILGIVLKVFQSITNAEDDDNIRSFREKREIQLLFDRGYTYGNLDHQHFIKKIGLEWQSCMKKTICEAHRNPKRYGLLAIPFHMFFPKPYLNTTNTSEKSEYRLAAFHGFTKSEDSNDDDSCHLNYNCFFDVLEIGLQLIELYERSMLINKL